MCLVTAEEDRCYSFSIFKLLKLQSPVTKYCTDQEILIPVERIILTVVLVSCDLSFCFFCGQDHDDDDDDDDLMEIHKNPARSFSWKLIILLSS